jgi:hypothetical protein
MVFGSGRLPQDLFRSEFWKNSQNEQTKSFQSCSLDEQTKSFLACSLDEQDIINEWNYKFKRRIVVIIKLSFIEIKYL